MRLTVLGSGTAVPHARRGSPGYLLRTAGTTLLVDPGSGSTHRLARAGASPHQVGAVLISHFHPDHCADLTAFLWACRVVGGGVRPPLHLIGPPGMAQHWTRLRETWGRALADLKFDVQVQEVLDRELSIGDLTARTAPVAHTNPTIGLRLTDPSGRVFAYSADSGECDTLVTLSDRADLFLCECSFPDSVAVEGHLSPASVARIAGRARPARVLLTHLYPDWDGADPAAEVRQAWSGDVRTAEDGGEYGV